MLLRHLKTSPSLGITAAIIVCAMPVYLVMALS